MKFYSYDLIEKFINGEDLGEYSREQLSDNEDFMQAVFKNKNDYKLYCCCSSRLQQDLKFIEKVINESHDRNFILNMARCFLTASSNEIDKLELSILAANLLPNKAGGLFRYIISLTYSDIRNKANIIKLNGQMNDEFSIISDLVNNNEIILYHFAKLMVKEIYQSNFLEFNKYLDENYEDLERYQDETIAIKYIEKFDCALAKYLSNHSEPLRTFIFAIERKKEKMGDTSLDNYYPVNYTIHEYMTKIGKENREEELLYYVLRKHGEAVRYAFANHMDLDETRKGEKDDESLKYVILNDRELKEVVSNIEKIISTEVYENKTVNVDSLIKESAKVLKYKPKNGN